MSPLEDRGLNRGWTCYVEETHTSTPALADRKLEPFSYHLLAWERGNVSSDIRIEPLTNAHHTRCVLNGSGVGLVCNKSVNCAE